MAAQGPRLDLKQPVQRTFLHLLLNTLVVSVMNFTVWFAGRRNEPDDENGYAQVAPAER